MADRSAPEVLRASTFAECEGVDDWRYVLGTIHAEFAFASFTVAARFVADVAVVADEVDHHPDVSLRYPGVVRVVCTTRVVDDLTALDVDLARTVSRLAAEHGAAAQPTEVADLEIAIDTMDADRIRPFWEAVLDYRRVANGALVDPRRRGPAIWFQQMESPRPDRNRIHLDVTVAHDIAEERVAAAIAAGGRLVSDARARAFWVLADVDGNEICVCTWQDRD